MYVARHAAQRYALRGCATVDPVSTLQSMWWPGQAADNNALSVFRVQREPGFEYRVCVCPYTKQRLLLVAATAQNKIVTVIGL